METNIDGKVGERREIDRDLETKVDRIFGIDAGGAEPAETGGESELDRKVDRIFGLM